MKPPTIVVFVQGGVVQDIEADGTARVIVCDYDCDAEAELLGNPCWMTEWHLHDGKAGALFQAVLEELEKRRKTP